MKLQVFNNKKKLGQILYNLGVKVNIIWYCIYSYLLAYTKEIAKLQTCECITFKKVFYYGLNFYHTERLSFENISYKELARSRHHRLLL